MDHSTNSKRKSKAVKASAYILISIAVILLGFITFNAMNSGAYSTSAPIAADTSSEKGLDSGFIKAVISDEDTSEHIINVSNPEDLNVQYGLDEEAGKNVRRVFSGRRINILITGVDSRLGANTKHADANHVLSILPDSGMIEIISIPRDTYANAGYDDSTGQNKLTVCRASRGHSGYMKEVARIAGLDKIHYYAEFGFSQAMGILEFLGYKNSAGALQVLRSRKGLGGDDYQRCYNQAQFIRQMLLSHFSKLTGSFSDIFIYGGLALVESNMDGSGIKGLVAQLKSKGFPRSGADIKIRLKPSVPIKFKVYDFTNKEMLAMLNEKIKRFNSSHELNEQEANGGVSNLSVYDRLNRATYNAAQDTAKRPARSITALKTFYEQRAWLQIPDADQREDIRNRFQKILVAAYSRRKDYRAAQNVNAAMEAERKLFHNSLN
ncbi:MAG: LCP family protein [Chloroflexota bacterium]